MSFDQKNDTHTREQQPPGLRLGLGAHEAVFKLNAAIEEEEEEREHYTKKK